MSNDVRACGPAYININTYKYLSIYIWSYTDLPMWEPELYATASATWLIEIRCFLTVHMCTLSHTNMCRVLSQHGAHLHVAADGQAPAGLQNATSAHPRVVSRHMLGELRLLHRPPYALSRACCCVRTCKWNASTSVRLSLERVLLACRSTLAASPM